MPTRGPIVWVIKEQVKRGITGPEPMDYTPAFKYGEVRFITDFDMPIHQGGSLVRAWNAAASQFAKEYDEDTDFIIATGQPTAMVMIGWILGISDSLPRFLVWRREDNMYVPFTPAEITDSQFAALT